MKKSFIVVLLLFGVFICGCDDLKDALAFNGVVRTQTTKTIKIKATPEQMQERAKLSTGYKGLDWGSSIEIIKRNAKGGRNKYRTDTPLEELFSFYKYKSSIDFYDLLNRYDIQIKVYEDANAKYYFYNNMFFAVYVKYSKEDINTILTEKYGQSQEKKEYKNPTNLLMNILLKFNVWECTDTNILTVYETREISQQYFNSVNVFYYSKPIIEKLFSTLKNLDEDYKEKEALLEKEQREKELNAL